MRTISARPLGGWVQKGSEIAIPFGAFRRLDNAEIGEDVLRVRDGRQRLNHTAPKRACLEGRITSLGYGLVKAHSTINPGNTNFTVECIVRLPKVNRPTVSSAYPLLVRSGSTSQSVIFALELFSTGAGGVLQARAHFTTFDTTAGPPWTATSQARAFTLPNRAEGTLVNIALRRGGTTGGTPASMELVVDGVVVGGTFTIPAGSVLYGSDAAENATDMPVGSTFGDRDFIDLFVLNSNPDYAYPPATPYNEVMQGDPRIQEVRFWSDSRSDAELLAWSRTELDVFQIAQPELKGYWPMSTGSGREEPNKKDVILDSAYLMPNPPIWGQTSVAEIIPEMGFTDWWRFEETSGTTARNSLSTRDGTFNNGVSLGKPPVIAADPNSFSAEFATSSPEQNVSVADNAVWTTGPYTMFACGLMKRPPGDATFNVSPMLLKEGPGWSFSVGFDNKPFFTIFDSSVGGKTSITAPDAQPLFKKWSQMATFDGTNTELFVNGVTKGSAVPTLPVSTAAGLLRMGATGSEQFVGFLDEMAFAAGVEVSADNALRLHRAAILGLPRKLHFLGRDHVVRLPYIASYDRIASTDPGKAVKTWTAMWRFRTGNYLQNYLANGETNSNRRFVLFQWGNDPALPQIRASILRAGANYNFIVETTHNGTVSTMTSTTNLLPNTTYTFWADRNGTALRLFLDGGTATVSTATITAANNGFGTGTEGDIFVGAGVSSEANADAYQHEKYFYGSIEEVRLYARVVAEDTRARTYLVELSKADIEADPDLLLDLQFQEGVGRTTLDLSKSANVGLLTRDYFHGVITTTPFQWSREKPPRWRAGFVTPQTAPAFNGLGSYVKEGDSVETLIGVAGGIAYEIGPELVEQIGTVANDEAVQDTRAFAAVAMENRLYLGDGRNPVVAVENGVVRPCGIADMPASAVPSIANGPGGPLLGFYSWATQLKSVFTGALSRVTKTEATRFRNERAIVGFGLNVPCGQFLTFDGTDDFATIAANAAYNTNTFTVEWLFRPHDVRVEHPFTRNIQLLVANQESLVSGVTTGSGVTSIPQPGPEFTYEIRFQYTVNPTGGANPMYVLAHPSTAGGVTGTIALRAPNPAVGANTDIVTRSGGADVVVSTLTTLTALVDAMVSVVHRSSGWEIYVNGDLFDTNGGATPDTALGSRPLYVGQDGGGTATSFCGMSVGEVRMWDYARAGTEIKETYKQEITDAEDLARLTVYWKLNEPSGGGLLSSSTKVGAVTGYVGTSAAATPTFEDDPVRNENSQNFQTLLMHQEAASDPGRFHVDLTDIDGALRFRYREGTGGDKIEIIRHPDTVENKWTHVAWSRDNATNEEKIYVDGDLISTTISPAHDVAPATGTVQIGRLGTNAQFFDGDIDEIRFWNVVRTQDQIQENIGNQLETFPTSLIGYWKLNNAVTDSSATANNISLAAPTATPVFTTMAGGQIPLGIDDFVSARRIYRSAGAIPASESEEDIQLAIDKAEAGPFYLVKEIEDNATTQFVDDLPDTSLSILLDEAHAGDPPYGGALSAFGDRLVVASPPDARSSVFVSGQDSTENFDIVGDALNVADTKAGAVTSVLDMTGVAKQALVFTETGGFSLQENGTRLELAKVFSGVGCVSRLGSARVEDIAYFWSREGPQRWAYGQPQPIGLDIEQAADDEVDHSRFSQIIAAHHVGRRQVQFLLVEVGSTKINAIYKFEYGSGRWIRDTGNLRAATLASIAPPDISSLLPGVIVADDLGYVLVTDRGKWDGAYLHESPFDNGRRVVLDGGGGTIQVSTDSLPVVGDGLKGVQVMLRSANGTEQIVTVTSNSGDIMTVTPTLSPVPLAGDTVFLGPIAFQALSGWLDLNGPEEPPSVTRKRFEWLIVHFDQDGLTSEMPVSVQFAVRERGYTPSPTFEGSVPIQLQASADTRNIAMENQPVRKFYIPNALGRFFKFRISGTKPSGWGLNQVDIAHNILVGSF